MCEMTGLEKLKQMTAEELIDLRWCPSDIGLQDDDDICEDMDRDDCTECRKRALEMECE